MKHPFAEARLIVTGHDVAVVTSNKEMISALSNPGQTYLSFVLDLSRTLGELVEVLKTELLLRLALPILMTAQSVKNYLLSVGVKPQHRGAR